jgi:thiamine pyrophosphokinase
LARRAGIIPHAIVGDLDSLDRRTKRWMDARRIERVVFPTAKEATDAELALRYVLAKGAGEVWLYSAVAGRMDQTLAHVMLLFQARALRVRAQLVGETARAWLVAGETSISGAVGDPVSLLPFSPTVEGVTTRGLRYVLDGAALVRGSTLGISNEIVEVPARVRITSGDLLVVHGFARLRRSRLRPRPCT